jgi:phosphoribosyl 1,2-cyclic phosphate phosphodiesterase
METLEVLRRVFSYAFNGEPSQSSSPRVDLRPITEEPFELFGMQVVPIKLMHGDGVTLGFRFGSLAYLTDHSAIPEESKAKLSDLDVLFLDALRHRPHPTHSTVAQSLASATEIGARRTFFTHICHDLPHAATELTLPPNVRLAYDGLDLEVAI